MLPFQRFLITTAPTITCLIITGAAGTAISLGMTDDTKLAELIHAPAFGAILLVLSILGMTEWFWRDV